jgi:hypothetical protein
MIELIAVDTLSIDRIGTCNGQMEIIAGNLLSRSNE